MSLSITAIMSRVTAPAAKLSQSLRSYSSSSSAIRTAAVKGQVDSQKRPVAAASSEVEAARPHSTLSTHRPTTTTYTPRPLMQGFRTSAPKQAQLDTSNIDFVVLPSLDGHAADNFANLRVPLLPDNYTPNRADNSVHALETPDAAVAPPQISIMAAHPENVMPVAMTEVVNNAGLDVDVGHWVSAAVPADEQEQSSLQQLLGGMMDDFFKGPAPKAAM